MDLLEQGDSVMADRGFTIADLLAARGVGLNIPPSKLQPQLTESELVETRRIASVRIHVERAIGRLKLYHILDSIPNSMARIADRIFLIHKLLKAPCVTSLGICHHYLLNFGPWLCKASAPGPPFFNLSFWRAWYAKSCEPRHDLDTTHSAWAVQRAIK